MWSIELQTAYNAIRGINGSKKKKKKVIHSTQDRGGPPIVSVMLYVVYGNFKPLTTLYGVLMD